MPQPRGGAVDGRPYSVAGAGGVKIGLLTEGSGQGHDAVDVAPGVLVAELERYLGSAPGR
jgi:hypothetical protein